MIRLISLSPSLFLFPGCLSHSLSPPRCSCLFRNEWEPPDKKVDTRKYRAEPKSIFEYEPGKSSVLKLERTVTASCVSCACRVSLHPHTPSTHSNHSSPRQLTRRRMFSLNCHIPRGCPVAVTDDHASSGEWSITCRESHCLPRFSLRLLD